MEKSPIKYAVIAGLAIVGLIVVSIINPFSWNDGGERTVVQQLSGKQFVQFESGVYYAGFFAKQTAWPNQISVSYQQNEADLDLNDNSIEIGVINIRFGGDATTANVKGITQYILPNDEKDMVLIHNTHRTPQSLVTKRLSPYTKECLQSSAQLMSSEMHYSGGRAQMAQDFIDQLKNGSFLLMTSEQFVFDSLEKEDKRVYKTEIQKNGDGTYKRKTSSIKEYNITVADAQVTDVDYEKQVDDMISKKVAASTKASVSKQELMTAQQQALTAKAKGEQALVEIEYEQKQDQTKQVVTAETRKEVAKLEKEAAELENQKIKILADAQSYQNAKLVAAGLTPQEKAEWEYKTKVGVAEKLSKVTLPNTYISGSNGNGQANLLESLLGVKLLEDRK
jgi:hypothetical protein